MNTTKTATARLASLGTVHACAVRRVGGPLEAGISYAAGTVGRMDEVPGGGRDGRVGAKAG